LQRKKNLYLRSNEVMIIAFTMNLNLFQSKLTKDAQGAIVNLNHEFASTSVDFSLNTWSVSAEFSMHQSLSLAKAEAPIYLYDEFEGDFEEEADDDEWFDDEEFEGDEIDEAEMDFDDEDFADDFDGDDWDEDDDDFVDDGEISDDDDDLA